MYIARRGPHRLFERVVPALPFARAHACDASFGFSSTCFEPFQWCAKNASALVTVCAHAPIGVNGHGCGCDSGWGCVGVCVRVCLCVCVAGGVAVSLCIRVCARPVYMCACVLGCVHSCARVCVSLYACACPCLPVPARVCLCVPVCVGENIGWCVFACVCLCRGCPYACMPVYARVCQCVCRSD